jgi:hypothetical protein
VLLCPVSFWFWWEIGFGLHTHVLRVQYSCGVVLVFWLRREIVFGVMDILSVQYSSVVLKYKHHQSHFNSKKPCWVSLFYRNNEIQTFCYCVSLSFFVWIYNHTVTIISQKYQELCLISKTILMEFLYFRETTC